MLISRILNSISCCEIEYLSFLVDNNAGICCKKTEYIQGKKDWEKGKGYSVGEDGLIEIDFGDWIRESGEGI